MAACDTPVGTELARASAKSVVGDVVARSAPGVPITPVTDCIIDNASGSEIISIAGDAAFGQPSPETIGLVVDIAGRPDTITCLVERAGPLVIPPIAAGSV